MRLSAKTRLAWLMTAHLLLAAAASHAQQGSGTAPTSAARRGYFTRVQTQASADAPARSARYGGPLDAATALGGRGTASDDRFRSGTDPLRPYGEPVQSTSLTRPYERVPMVSPPQRGLPPVSHNYFPGMRPGQGPNRNVAHCVPGRHAFLHR
jgi:hypothetical protein